MILFFFFILLETVLILCLDDIYRFLVVRPIFEASILCSFINFTFVSSFPNEIQHLLVE